MEIDANKSTILLIHGSGLSHIVWSLHEQFYASSGFNVLAVDLPGHGNSDGPAIKSIQEISDWIKKLMQEINIKKITVPAVFPWSVAIPGILFTITWNDCAIVVSSCGTDLNSKLFCISSIFPKLFVMFISYTS